MSRLGHAWLCQLLFLTSLVFAATPNVCPSGWQLENGRCFIYRATPRTWNDADSDCRSLDSSDVTLHIADPRTQAENDRVNSMGCRTNDSPFASAWNVWAGTTDGSINNDGTWGNFNDNNPTVKFVCACTPPPGPIGSNDNWCVDRPSSTYPVRAGMPLESNTGDCYKAPSPSRCSSPRSSSRNILCKPPAVPAPTPTNTGRGQCWLGGARSSIDSSGTLSWAVSATGVTKNIVGFAQNQLEASLNILASPTPSQAQYTRTPTPGYGSVKAPPNCLALWNYNEGKWIVDYCNRPLPYVCVKDALCDPGYYKSATYSVTSGGTVNAGSCALCAGGKYRAATDEQAPCKDCLAGYYGSSSNPRTGPTCDGPCPAGTYCTAGTVNPTKCGVGFYGRALQNPAGPGYTSAAESCVECTPGYYCDQQGMVFADQKKCRAGYCGYDKQSTQFCSRTCMPGYYCPEGEGSACPGRPCGDGFLGGAPVGANAYCPEGSVTPQTVPVGYYGIGGNTTNTNSAVLACPAGFFCTNGIRTPCAEGTYSSTEFSLAERVACKPCRSGYYCPPPSSPTEPSSTSAFQEFCAPSGAEFPARYYCVNGLRSEIPSNDYMTIPTNVPTNVREGMVACPGDKVCENGLAYDRLTWDNCPNNQVTVSVPELFNQLDTEHMIKASLQSSLAEEDYDLDYHVLSQAFADPSQLAQSTSASCRAGTTINDGIFSVDPATGTLQVLRHSPSPTNPAGALQFEACEPLTDIRYSLMIQASARHKYSSIQANITCAVSLVVTNVNDQPIFPSAVNYRVIAESAAENTPAGRCLGIDGSTGCPDDATPSADPAVSAYDEDDFGQGNLEYSFVGTLSPAHEKLKINQCTGLISQKGGDENILRFSDPTIPFVGVTNFKRLTYTVRAQDDGNGGKFDPQYTDTTVHVYIENVNDRPIFLVNSSIDIWVPESTSAHRYPPGTATSPSSFPVFDDDGDEVTLFLARNDAEAFEVVGGMLRTTVAGENVIDFESTKKTFSIDLEARDNGVPPLASILTVNIRVVNINDPPVLENNLVFFIAEDAGANDPVCRDKTGKCTVPNPEHAIKSTDPDNIATDVTTYSLLVNPGNLFQINATSGQVSLVNSGSLNFENEALRMTAETGRGYTLRVQAKSSGAGVVTQLGLTAQEEVDVRNFTVYIVDVNENPSFTTSAAVPFRVVETWPVGRALFHVQIRATDPDNEDVLLFDVAAPRQELTFSLSSTSTGATDGAEFFSVSTDPSDNSLARIVVKKPLDYETAPLCGVDRCYTLRIRVTDNGGPVQGVAEEVFTIHLVDVNEIPSFTQNTYTLSAPESLTYASQIDLVSGVPLKANDLDQGGNAGLEYTVLGGDGFAQFGIASLGAGNGFKVFKNSNILLNYEVKPSYSIRVQVKDTLGGSSFIGKSCTIDQGVSVGCGTAAYCFNSQCYETCPTYINGATVVLPQDVPRRDIFFCQDLTQAPNNMVRNTSLYRETAEATVMIALTDDNDPPYVVDKPLDVPRPDYVTNLNCLLDSVVSFNFIAGRDQFPFSQIQVWDDDSLGALDRAGPFVFSTDGSAFWLDFELNNTATGRVRFKQCIECHQYAENNSYSGQIRVTDKVGGTSVCNIRVNITGENIPPVFPNSEITLMPVSEFAEAGYIVQPGFSIGEINEIDGDTASTPADNLTFTTTFSNFFDVNRYNATITLRQSLDYETLFPTFSRSILLRVSDLAGADDVMQIIVPVKDENEAPFWSAPITNGAYQIEVFENIAPLTVIGSLTGFAEDPDIYAVNASWRTTTVSLGDTTECGANCPFEIVSGDVRVKAGAVLDFEGARNSWAFNVRVADGAGLFSDLRVRVSLKNVNEPPRFTATSNVSILEGSAGPLGRDLLEMSNFVADPDANDPISSLTYEITDGNVGDVFEISADGQLRLAPNRVLDYETRREYNVSLTVRDSGGLESDGWFIILVKNVNDVTVSSISVISGPNAGSQKLACDGTVSRVLVTGTNFGMAGNEPAATVTLRYRRSVSAGPAAPIFLATNCVITTPGTQFECDVSSGGAGTALIWDVVIAVPTTEIVSDGVSAIGTSISFPEPSITSVSGANEMNTAGGQTVTISGSCLGIPADNLAFGASTTDSFVELCTLFDSVCRAMPTGCSATSASGSTIVCTAATLPGLGASTSFRARVARASSNTRVEGGYGRPSITSSSLTTLRTSGVISPPGLVLNGTNFGGLGTLPTIARLHYNNSEGEDLAVYNLIGCTVTLAYKQVTCTSHQPGIGHHLRIELQFGLQTNPDSPLLSFESPVVTSVATDGNALSPSAGGIFVTLTGSSFGPVCGVPGTSSTSGAVNCNLITATYSRGSISVSTNQEIRYVPTFCAVISQTQVVCTTVEGTGRDHTWTLTVGGQPAFVSPTAGKTGYSSPVVGAYAGPGAEDALTSGNQYIDLDGAHFGPVGGAPVSAQYGNELFPTEFTAVNCAVTIAHTRMRCFTGVGAGDALSWKVTVDGQLSRAQLSDYGPPTITQVLLGASPANNLRDDGGETVTLVGNNFGPPGSTSFLESVAYGPSTFRSMYQVTSRCTVTSHESIQCQTLPSMGRNLIWQVRVRGQVSTTTTAVSSVALPTLTSISATTGRTNGGEAVLITGSSFGFCDRNVQVRVAFGNTLVDISRVFRQGSVDPIDFASQCNPGLPISYGTERMLQFAVPEMTASNTITVGVQVDSVVFTGGFVRAAQTFTYTYANPTITDVFAEPGSNPGDILVTLTGSNFCRSEACCQTYLDGSVVSSRVTVHTHDRISFIANGPGTTFVRCPGGDTEPQVFSSQNPYVYGVVRVSDFQRIDKVTFDTRGGDEIYVFSMFAGAAATVTIGGNLATDLLITTFLCDDTTPGFVPDTIDSILPILVPGQVCTRIHVRVPPGDGINNEVIATLGSLKSRADDVRFEFLKYTPPSISGLSASFGQTFKTSGDPLVRLTVTGLNFGLSGKILFGPASFENSRNEISCVSGAANVTWNHTAVSCLVPAGEGSALDVRVRADNQISGVATMGKLKYQRPVVTGFTIQGTTDNLADTSGGETLVITGSNFGRPYNASAIALSPGQLPVVSIGPTSTCIILSSTHNSIRCSIPPGDGRNLNLGVIIAGEPPMVLSPTTFAYGRPQVYFLSPNHGRTDGKDAQGNRQVLQIIGKNFGVDQLRVEFGTVNGPVLLGRRSSRDLVDNFLYPGTNHTSIRVYLPSYFGANLNVTVTVNGQVSVSPGPQFSYDSPVIGNVTTSKGGRQLAEDSLIDNDDWTSGNGTAAFGSCRPVRADNSSSSSAVKIVYKEMLEITPGGAFTRTYQFYSLPNFTSVNETSCSTPAFFLGESIQNGVFTDFGEHPTVGCMRVYRATVSTASGFPIPAQLAPNGGFGFYLVSERKDLYISLSTFATQAAAVDNPDLVNFDFESGPLVSLKFGLPPSLLPPQPTSGCYVWESADAYRAKVDASFSSGGPVNLPRQCISPALVTVTGQNFGSDIIAPQGALRVYLVDDRGVEYEASTTTSGGNHGLVCTAAMGCKHEDTSITFQVPMGSGRGLAVRVVLGDLNRTSGPLVDYASPDQSLVTPGTLNEGSSFMSAAGSETIRIIGENLGYETSRFSVLINGRECRNTSWISGFSEPAGRSSIQCLTPPDVAGIKSVFMCVGGQGKMVIAKDVPDDVAAIQYGQQRGSWNTTSAPILAAATTVRALAVSRCPPGTYGRLNELCVPCPIGANCYPGFSLPVPQETFALLTMASDSVRALEGSCPQERLDKSLAQQFPDIAFYETCNQIVRCIPNEACLAAGQCAEGYEYQLYRCRLKRNETDDNSCRVFFDPSVGSYRGVNSDCQRNTAPDKTCSFEHPEDCSECVVRFANSDPSSAYGTCECTQPQRCALCTATTHYRLNNECVKCPDNPALVFSLFILAGVACIGLAYYLQKRKINLAFLSIGIDYFQILAVLSTTNVPWPPFIRAIFTIFTLFLASIDIAAPECLVPNLEFPTKFYLTELLPLVALMILLCIHTGYTIYKVYKLGMQAKWLSHVSRLIGIYVLIIYVLYLSLTKRALDVFNCNPLDPDDGYAYTAFSSLSCDGGGLCRCYEPGGLQDSLVAPAIVFLAIYTFGFPMFVAYVVFRHKEEIREDQYLRANRLGERRETNPRAYDTRKRFQLMYMHFKPKYSFWMLCILARKFGVAFASLMFRGNPSFQLAVILMVLFISFTLQVSLRPYMSPGEFPVVVKELNDSSKKADEDPEQFAIYRDLFRKVQESMRIQAELIRKEKMIRHKMGAGFWEESKQAAREHDKRSAAEKYFFDLNAVEAVLLGATIIISLAGIMFESGRFQTTREDIQWQGDLVVVLVFIVLFGSLGYYILVFINELFPITFARRCGRCFLRYQNDGITNEELDKMKDNDIVLDANPLFAASGPVGDKSKSLQKEIEASKDALALAKRQNEELKRLKAELEAGGAVTAQNPLALRELMNTGKPT